MNSNMDAIITEFCVSKYRIHMTITSKSSELTIENWQKMTGTLSILW